MRQLLPKRALDSECGIINLGDLDSDGSHWTCYIKEGPRKLYFDSFGNAQPPKELIDYIGGDMLLYNIDRIQDFHDPPICGHLCLEVLRRHTNNESWKNIVRTLTNNKMIWQSWFVQ